MKRILPYLLAISLLMNGFFAIRLMDGSNNAVKVNSVQVTQADANPSIQVIAKRPYIKKGEVGVLALKCAPDSNCKIICSYRVGGRDFTTTRNIVAGRDGSVLCTWKVDKNTDAGTYQIEILCGQNRLVTNYVVQ
ncbi:hypothetical protein CLHUN_41610 [Ruminiclostridium hungatei]|uniref:Uncharacterized protein n=1 Tax=Ruminiclostridium hungatei TaxID=48256 RepID=A0A1V4SDJ1_RUMHU|nr:hypothetical protein [Ruminiclostridium hungatei]OPX41989.1 hypothetical protein CLHUN_41610 [Ruminiclostridium hungatei]